MENIIDIVLSNIQCEVFTTVCLGISSKYIYSRFNVWKVHTFKNCYSSHCLVKYFPRPLDYDKVKTLLSNTNLLATSEFMFILRNLDSHNDFVDKYMTTKIKIVRLLNKLSTGIMKTYTNTQDVFPLTVLFIKILESSLIINRYKFEKDFNDLFTMVLFDFAFPYLKEHHLLDRLPDSTDTVSCYLKASMLGKSEVFIGQRGGVYYISRGKKNYIR